MQDRGQGTKLCVAPAVPPQLQLAACQPPAPATWSPARRRTTMLVKRAPGAAPAQTPLTQALAWAFPAQVRQDAWLRGSIPLRTCMEQGRGAGISMDQGVPDHWRGEMRKGRSSASHRGTPLTPAITYTAPATHTQQAQQRTCSPPLPVFRAGSPGHGPGEGLLLRDISLLGGQQTLPWEVNSFL